MRKALTAEVKLAGNFGCSYALVCQNPSNAVFPPHKLVRPWPYRPYWWCRPCVELWHANTVDSLSQLTSLDAEGRAVLTEHRCGEGGRRLVVVNVYCPLARMDGDNPGRLEYKLKFYSALRDRCAALETAGR